MDNANVIAVQKICEDKGAELLCGTQTAMPPFASQHLSADPVRVMLARAHVSAICRHTGSRLAAQILRDSGLLAGEDYAYCHMDFEDSFSRFARDLCKVGHHTGLPHWQVSQYSANTGEVVLCFTPWKGCPAKEHNTSSLLCEYMQGFAQGIVAAYTGREYKVYRQCRRCIQGARQNVICRYALEPLLVKTNKVSCI